ncbi:isopentenyl-diphosphate Delta-isomerase [Boseongicola sp. H5]|uniref:isopentenyl-diphosphate Delta-isomerase n=1 Tax=Boseongicola sp. H5 TaxID=2763261 RepID=UPI001D09EA99|nr:isopentenyl-diphosphate Delta-isomerase [Boseongicola sp. H5]
MTEMIPTWVDGVLTPVEKLEAHRKGLRHQAISVFLMRGNKTLLQRRALGKYHTPGLWANTCCTHPYWGESALDCAQRRLGDELGLPPIPLTFRDRVEYRADVGGGMIEHEVVDIFVGTLPETVPVLPNPAEVMDTIWQGLDDLAQEVVKTPASFTPWLQIYLRDHAASIFGDMHPA